MNITEKPKRQAFSVSIPEDDSIMVRDYMFELESYHHALNTSHGEQKEEYRKEWLECRSKYDDAVRTIIHTYGVTCDEYFKLKHPKPGMINTNVSRLILPLDDFIQEI